MSDRGWSGWGLALRVALLNLGYTALLVVAYQVAFSEGLLSPSWWPAAGLLLGALVRAPVRAWPWLVGSVFATLLVLGLLQVPAPRQPPPAVSLVWAVDGVLVPLIGAWLLRLARFEPALARVRDVIAFVGLGAVLPGLVGLLFLLLGWWLWPAPAPPFDPLTAWAAEFLGILVVAPLLLTWSAAALPERFSWRAGETVLLALSLAAASWAVFGTRSSGFQVTALAAATFPLLAWAALRFGVRGAAWATFFLTSLATWLVLQGTGPFEAPETEPLPVRVLYVQVFFGFAAFSALLLGALSSERRLEAAERGRALDLLDAVLRAAPVGIAVLDGKLRYLRINEFLARYNGLTVDEHRGRTVADVRPDLVPMVGPLVGRILETGEPELGREFTAKSPEPGAPSRVWLSNWFPVRGSAARPESVAAVLVDITERREQENALRHSEERFRSLAEASANLIWSVDAAGGALAGAEAWEVFTGEPAAHFLAGRWLDAVHPEDREAIMETWKDDSAKGQPFTLFFRLHRRDGIYRHMEARVVPLRDRTGQVREWVGMSVDVTERVETTRELARLYEEAQAAIRARDDFLTAASHELKTPLTPLAARLQFLERQVAAGQPVDPTSVARMRRSLDRLTQLIDGLLDVSPGRQVATPLVPTRLDELVAEVAAGWRDHSALHQLRVERGDGPMLVGADPGRLSQVLDHLLSNAFKFSPAGGEIVVQVGRRDGEVEVAVHDPGIGILPEDRAGIFERFFRGRNASVRSYGGLGLGLAISGEIVRQHGGRMELESAPGEGSTFRFLLPALSGS